MYFWQDVEDWGDRMLVGEECSRFGVSCALH